MSTKMRLWQTIPLLSLLLGSNIEATKPKNAILLSEVRSLTLRANAKTSHRRVPAIPQLTCEGPGCAFYQVDLMRCKNQGSSYNPEDVEWSCSATIPREFKLGSTDVLCEGYSNRDDKFVLKGSCGVRYRLLLTEIGDEKFGRYKALRGVQWGFHRTLFTIVFSGILFWILYSVFRALPDGNFFRRLNRFWGGGGGGGGGYPWDPPPPYSGKRYYSQQRQTAWRPGFWAGVLGGVAAGYMAGNRRNSQEFPFPQRRSGFFNERENDNTRSSRMTNTSRSARYESTGFGSTSRR